MRYFLIGCAIGLVLVIVAKMPLALLVLLPVIFFVDWSGKGDGRQRYPDE